MTAKCVFVNTRHSNHLSSINKTLEKTEGAIKNGQSRDIGNIGQTIHKTKTSKTKNTTQTITKMSYTDTNKTGGDPRCLRREAVPASYKTSTRG